MLSGEMRDTAELGAVEAYAVEMLVSRSDRSKVMRQWPGLATLLPKGGNAVWGNSPAMVQAGQDSISATNSVRKSEYSHLPFFEHNTNSSALPRERRWANPLLDPLPAVPEIQIVCIYGVNKTTEIGYHYHKDPQSDQFVMDTTVNEGNPLFSPEEGGRATINGVVNGDGDGTVPLESLGYMCVEGWKKGGKLNPAAASVVTREYVHSPDGSARGGSDTADHVVSYTKKLLLTHC